MAAAASTGTAVIGDECVLGIERGEPWLDDGSIVLRAHKTYFRVHCSVLARNAEVFADMFQMPQPEAQVEGPVIEGCPVLELSDDPSELSHFLQALYDGRRYFSHTIHLPFNAIVALIRLGTKYQAIHLRDEGLTRLQPITAALLSSNELSNAPSELYKRKCAVTLANLAQTHDLDELLPLALYACCQLPKDQIRENVTAPPGQGPSADETVLEKLEKLLPINTERCLAARERFASYTQQMVSDTVWFSRCHVCAYKHNPEKICWWKIKTASSSPGIVTVAAWNPCRWLEIWWGDISTMWLCQACGVNTRAFYNQRKEGILEKLPEYFGLPEKSPTSRTTDPSRCSCIPS